MAKNDLGFTIPDGIAADMLIFTMIDKKLNVLLIERTDKIESGKALVGGFLDPNENLKQCAIRETKEEIHLDVSNEKLYLVGEYSNPDRDKRARVISIAYGTKLPYEKASQAYAGDDAANVVFVPAQDIIDNKVKLAFDHRNIVIDGIETMNLESYVKLDKIMDNQFER